MRYSILLFFLLLEIIFVSCSGQGTDNRKPGKVVEKISKKIEKISQKVTEAYSQYKEDKKHEKAKKIERNNAREEREKYYLGHSSF